MQIEIDFDVYKALTARRESEADGYNSVLRRVLGLPPSPTANAGAASEIARLLSHSQHSAGKPDRVVEALLQGGAWFNNVGFPEGTAFRAIYKGTPHLAQIKDGRWVGTDGIVRNSPSEAASAISGTNVNGWRFWYALRPGDTEWRRLDEFRP
ncbi:MAG: DUF4357 domain-containing protein [Sphingobium sp.]|nr:DUF4357 domain-containing protein [Sphingobium sp.]